MVLKWCIIVIEVFSMYLVGIAQYHQSDYNVKLNILELVNVNPSYGSDMKLGLQWYNRTTRVINGNWTLIKDWGTNVKMKVQIYKFLSNEYRFFPLTLTSNLCVDVSTNMYGLRDFFNKYSNMAPACPVKKHFYYIRNGQMDFSLFPPYMPTGDYKFEGKVYNGQDFVWQLDVYGSIQPLRK